MTVLDLAEVALPLRTFNGVKFHETVGPPPRGKGNTCDRCQYQAGCALDVLERDGFAWCEELLPVDLDPSYVETNR